MMISANTTASAALGTALLSLFVSIAVAQEKKEATYRVAPRAIVSISNNYGPITVKGSVPGQVVVNMTSSSLAVKFENEQHGNRIEMRVSSTASGDNLAEYIVLVPADTWVTMRSSGGGLRAESLGGDLTLDAETGPIVVSDVRDAHLHLRSMSGPITLTGIRKSQVDVNSLSGNITLLDVVGSWAAVYSGTGRISYTGDPGSEGDYSLTTHTGDVEISIPATSAVDIKPHSLNGEFSQEPLGSSAGVEQQSLLPKSRMARAVFLLRSLRGKIHVKRP